MSSGHSSDILDLYLRKTRGRKSWSRNYRDAIFFEKLRFPNVFCPHENEKPNSFALKSIREKLRPRDGSLWTISARPPFLNFAGIDYRPGLIAVFLNLLQIWRESTRRSCFQADHDRLDRNRPGTDLYFPGNSYGVPDNYSLRKPICAVRSKGLSWLSYWGALAG